MKALLVLVCLCEIFLINSLFHCCFCARVSVRLLRSCVADLCVNVCAYARRACGDSSSSALSAILWNAASLGSFESTLGFQNPKAFDLFFFLAVSLPGREPPRSLSLSQLGWTHTWKCWPDSTLRPNLVIQRRGSAGGGGGEGWKREEGREGGRWRWKRGVGGSRGWKSQPPQDQRQPRLRPANPTSALYKDLPPHPNFDSHAIS